MSLGVRVIAQSAVFFVGIGLLVFLPAGTLDFPQAWLFIAVLGAITTAISAYFFVRDPALLERRLALGERGEPEPIQKLIQAGAAVAFFGMLVLAGLDRRFGWSDLPLAVSLAGYPVILIGYWIVFQVFRCNTYTSAVVEVAAGQTVISTGPYAIVRHPMYSGALLAIAGTPVALGSLVALVCVALLIAVIVARLVGEERYLRANLPGYTAYTAQTRFRLVPKLW